MKDEYMTKSPVMARLVQYIKYTGKSVNAFETEWGVSKNYIRNTERYIKPEYLDKLMSDHPDIDLNWLIAGRGSMLLSESKNLNENKPNSVKQNEEGERNGSIDELINQKINEAVMENLDKTIATIMKGMNKNNEQQNAHVEKILKIQSEENSRNFNTLIDAVREIVREEDREKFDRKIVQLKTKLG